MNPYTIILALAGTLFTPTIASAVDEGEDIATTIKLRGYDCPGKKVASFTKEDHTDGSKQIDATCGNGKQYRITVTSNGLLSVTPR